MTVLPCITQRLLRPMEHNLKMVEILESRMFQGVSAAIKCLGGYDPRELAGRRHLEIMLPEDREYAAESAARAVHGTRPETVRFFFVA